MSKTQTETGGAREALAGRVRQEASPTLYRIRTTRASERIIEGFEKGKWRLQIGLRGEEMNDIWARRWIQSWGGVEVQQ